MTFLKIESVWKKYAEDPSGAYAIKDINLDVAMGEFVAVMGESGAGKSTLLSVLGAMNRPTRGSYIVDDIDVYALTTEQQADFRREYVGFVFQAFHLIPYLTVMENVMLPIASAKLDKRRKHAMAMEALNWVGLANKAGRLPGQISGGEKERTAVARAIVNHPPLLLADEPTGNLDSHNTNEMMKLLTELNAGGTTIIMVTHSRACASYARRVVQVRDGRLADSKRGPAVRTDAGSRIAAA